MTDPGIRTIVAVTTEDDRYRAVRSTAEQRARDEHATLILYDLTAGENPFDSPLPTNWSSEGQEESVSDRLGPEELEAAGRAEIAKQVREARDRGIDAWGWLPDADDDATLLAYAADQPGALVLVPPGDLEVGDAADVEVAVVGDER